MATWDRPGGSERYIRGGGDSHGGRRPASGLSPAGHTHGLLGPSPSWGRAPRAGRAPRPPRGPCSPRGRAVGVPPGLARSRGREAPGLGGVGPERVTGRWPARAVAWRLVSAARGQWGGRAPAPRAGGGSRRAEWAAVPWENAGRGRPASPSRLLLRPGLSGGVWGPALRGGTPAQRGPCPARPRCAERPLSRAGRPAGGACSSARAQPHAGPRARSAARRLNAAR